MAVSPDGFFCVAVSPQCVKHSFKGAKGEMGKTIRISILKMIERIPHCRMVRHNNPLKNST